MYISLTLIKYHVKVSGKENGSSWNIKKKPKGVLEIVGHDNKHQFFKLSILQNPRVTEVKYINFISQ